MSWEEEGVREFEKKYGLVFSLFVGSGDKYKERWRGYFSRRSKQMEKWVARGHELILLNIISLIAADGGELMRDFMEMTVSHPDKQVCLALCNQFLLPPDLLMVVLMRSDFSEEELESIFSRQADMGLAEKEAENLIRDLQTLNLVIKTLSLPKLSNFG